MRKPLKPPLPYTEVRVFQDRGQWGWRFGT